MSESSHLNVPAAASVYLAFAGHELLAEGTLAEVAVAVHGSAAHQAGDTVLLFASDNGRQIDIDLSGTRDEVRARHADVTEITQDADAPDAGTSTEAVPASRGRGRPKLGVVGREVTLLPRHWDWLATQRGGASAALRRLVDAARKANAAEDQVRASQDRTHRLMTALAGNLPDFEEASRALYTGQRALFLTSTESWPGAVRDQVRAFADDALG